jgi:hypothetical protein
MKNANVVRTATIATLAAFVIATGLMNSQEAAMEAPAAPLASGSSPAYYFPASYQLEPGAGEPEVFEYH